MITTTLSKLDVMHMLAVQITIILGFLDEEMKNNNMIVARIHEYQEPRAVEDVPIPE